MIELSTAGKLALFVAIPTTVLLLYCLLKRSDEEEEEQPKVKKSRQTVIEVTIPQKAVGAVIGRQGSHIKHIQETTGARVHFKDDSKSSKDSDRVVEIRGTSESAGKAELLIRKVIADMPVIIVEELYVPTIAVGRIIGSGGENIRSIQSASKCKTYIEKSADRKSQNSSTLVRLTGSRQQIDLAKSMIEEKIQEEEVFRAKAAVNASNREQRSRQRKDAQIVCEKAEVSYSSTAVASRDNWDTGQVCEWPEQKEYLEVYVSAMEHPGHFWVQLLSSNALQLDSLTEQMTVYYNQEHTKETHSLDSISVGDIVAAPFTDDNQYYRARVVGFEDDKIDLYFVDYGDDALVAKENIRQLRVDFLGLPFQAIECFMANVKPKDDEWCDQSSDDFEELSYCAKWKVIMAKTVSYRRIPSGPAPCLQLIDTNGKTDLNLNEEMVKRGHAVWDEETIQADTVTPVEAETRQMVINTLEGEMEKFWKHIADDNNNDGNNQPMMPLDNTDWATDYPWAWAYNEDDYANYILKKSSTTTKRTAVSIDASPDLTADIDQDGALNDVADSRMRFLRGDTSTADNSRQNASAELLSSNVVRMEDVKRPGDKIHDVEQNIEVLKDQGVTTSLGNNDSVSDLKLSHSDQMTKTMKLVNVTENATKPYSMEMHLSEVDQKSQILNVNKLEKFSETVSVNGVKQPDLVSESNISDDKTVDNSGILLSESDKLLTDSELNIKTMDGSYTSQIITHSDDTTDMLGDTKLIQLKKIKSSDADLNSTEDAVTTSKMENVVNEKPTDIETDPLVSDMLARTNVEKVRALELGSHQTDDINLESKIQQYNISDVQTNYPADISASVDTNKSITDNQITEKPDSKEQNQIAVVEDYSSELLNEIWQNVSLNKESEEEPEADPYSLGDSGISSPEYLGKASQMSFDMIEAEKKYMDTECVGLNLDDLVDEYNISQYSTVMSNELEERKIMESSVTASSGGSEPVQTDNLSSSFLEYRNDRVSDNDEASSEHIAASVENVSTQDANNEVKNKKLDESVSNITEMMDRMRLSEQDSQTSRVALNVVENRELLQQKHTTLPEINKSIDHVENSLPVTSRDFVKKSTSVLTIPCFDTEPLSVPFTDRGYSETDQTENTVFRSDYKINELNSYTSESIDSDLQSIMSEVSVDSLAVNFDARSVQSIESEGFDISDNFDAIERRESSENILDSFCDDMPGRKNTVTENLIIETEDRDDTHRTLNENLITENKKGDTSSISDDTQRTPHGNLITETKENDTSSASDSNQRTIVETAVTETKEDDTSHVSEDIQRTTTDNSMKVTKEDETSYTSDDIKRTVTDNLITETKEGDTSGASDDIQRTIIENSVTKTKDGDSPGAIDEIQRTSNLIKAVKDMLGTADTQKDTKQSENFSQEIVVTESNSNLLDVPDCYPAEDTSDSEQVVRHIAVPMITFSRDEKVVTAPESDAANVYFGKDSDLYKKYYSKFHTEMAQSFSTKESTSICVDPTFLSTEQSRSVEASPVVSRENTPVGSPKSKRKVFHFPDRDEYGSDDGEARDHTKDLLDQLVRRMSGLEMNRKEQQDETSMSTELETKTLSINSNFEEQNNVYELPTMSTVESGKSQSAPSIITGQSKNLEDDTFDAIKNAKAAEAEYDGDESSYDEDEYIESDDKHLIVKGTEVISEIIVTEQDDLLKSSMSNDEPQTQFSQRSDNENNYSIDHLELMISQETPSTVEKSSCVHYQSFKFPGEGFYKEELGEQTAPYTESINDVEMKLKVENDEVPAKILKDETKYLLSEPDFDQIHSLDHMDRTIGNLGEEKIERHDSSEQYLSQAPMIANQVFQPSSLAQAEEPFNDILSKDIEVSEEKTPDFIVHSFSPTVSFAEADAAYWNGKMLKFLNDEVAYVTENEQRQTLPVHSQIEDSYQTTSLIDTRSIDEVQIVPDTGITKTVGNDSVISSKHVDLKTVEKQIDVSFSENVGTSKTDTGQITNILNAEKSWHHWAEKPLKYADAEVLFQSQNVKPADNQITVEKSESVISLNVRQSEVILDLATSDEHVNLVKEANDPATLSISQRESESSNLISKCLMLKEVDTKDQTQCSSDTVSDSILSDGEVTKELRLNDQNNLNDDLFVSELNYKPMPANEKFLGVDEMPSSLECTELSDLPGNVKSDIYRDSWNIVAEGRELEPKAFSEQSSLNAFGTNSLLSSDSKFDTLSTFSYYKSDWKPATISASDDLPDPGPMMKEMAERSIQQYYEEQVCENMTLPADSQTQLSTNVQIDDEPMDTLDESLTKDNNEHLPVIPVAESKLLSAEHSDPITQKMIENEQFSVGKDESPLLSKVMNVGLSESNELAIMDQSIEHIEIHVPTTKAESFVKPPDFSSDRLENTRNTTDQIVETDHVIKETVPTKELKAETSEKDVLMAESEASKWICNGWKFTQEETVSRENIEKQKLSVIATVESVSGIDETVNECHILKNESSVCFSEATSFDEISAKDIILDKDIESPEKDLKVRETSEQDSKILQLDEKEIAQAETFMWETKKLKLDDEERAYIMYISKMIDDRKGSEMRQNIESSIDHREDIEKVDTRNTLVYSKSCKQVELYANNKIQTEDIKVTESIIFKDEESQLQTVDTKTVKDDMRNDEHGDVLHVAKEVPADETDMLQETEKCDTSDFLKQNVVEGEDILDVTEQIVEEKQYLTRTDELDLSLHLSSPVAECKDIMSEEDTQDTVYEDVVEKLEDKVSPKNIEFQSDELDLHSNLSSTIKETEDIVDQTEGVEKEQLLVKENETTTCSFVEISTKKDKADEDSQQWVKEQQVFQTDEIMPYSTINQLSIEDADIADKLKDEFGEEQSSLQIEDVKNVTHLQDTANTCEYIDNTKHIISGELLENQTNQMEVPSIEMISLQLDDESDYVDIDQVHAVDHTEHYEKTVTEDVVLSIIEPCEETTMLYSDQNNIVNSQKMFTGESLSKEISKAEQENAWWDIKYFKLLEDETYYMENTVEEHKSLYLPITSETTCLSTMEKVFEAPDKDELIINTCESSTSTIVDVQNSPVSIEHSVLPDVAGGEDNVQYMKQGAIIKENAVDHTEYIAECTSRNTLVFSQSKVPLIYHDKHFKDDGPAVTSEQIFTEQIETADKTKQTEVTCILESNEKTVSHSVEKIPKEQDLTSLMMVTSAETENVLWMKSLKQLCEAETHFQVREAAKILQKDKTDSQQTTETFNVVSDLNVDITEYSQNEIESDNGMFVDHTETYMPTPSKSYLIVENQTKPHKSDGQKLDGELYSESTEIITFITKKEFTTNESTPCDKTDGIKDETENEGYEDTYMTENIYNSSWTEVSSENLFDKKLSEILLQVDIDPRQVVTRVSDIKGDFTEEMEDTEQDQINVAFDQTDSDQLVDNEVINNTTELVEQYESADEYPEITQTDVTVIQSEKTDHVVEVFAAGTDMQSTETKSYSKVVTQTEHKTDQYMYATLSPTSRIPVSPSIITPAPLSEVTSALALCRVLESGSKELKSFENVQDTNTIPDESLPVNNYQELEDGRKFSPRDLDFQSGSDLDGTIDTEEIDEPDDLAHRVLEDSLEIILERSTSLPLINVIESQSVAVDSSKSMPQLPLEDENLIDEGSIPEVRRQSPYDNVLPVQETIPEIDSELDESFENEEVYDSSDVVNVSGISAFSEDIEFPSADTLSNLPDRSYSLPMLKMSKQVTDSRVTETVSEPDIREEFIDTDHDIDKSKVESFKVLSADSFVAGDPVIQDLSPDEEVDNSLDEKTMVITQKDKIPDIFDEILDTAATVEKSEEFETDSIDSDQSDGPDILDLFADDVEIEDLIENTEEFSLSESASIVSKKEINDNRTIQMQDDSFTSRTEIEQSTLKRIVPAEKIIVSAKTVEKTEEFETASIDSDQSDGPDILDLFADDVEIEDIIENREEFSLSESASIVSKKEINDNYTIQMQDDSFTSRTEIEQSTLKRIVPAEKIIVSAKTVEKTEEFETASIDSDQSDGPDILDLFADDVEIEDIIENREEFPLSESASIVSKKEINDNCTIQMKDDYFTSRTEIEQSTLKKIVPAEKIIVSAKTVEKTEESETASVDSDQSDGPDILDLFADDVEIEDFIDNGEEHSKKEYTLSESASIVGKKETDDEYTVQMQDDSIYSLSEIEHSSLKRNFPAEKIIVDGIESQDVNITDSSNDTMKSYITSISIDRSGDYVDNTSKYSVLSVMPNEKINVQKNTDETETHISQVSIIPAAIPIETDISTTEIQITGTKQTSFIHKEMLVDLDQCSTYARQVSTASIDIEQSESPNTTCDYKIHEFVSEQNVSFVSEVDKLGFNQLEVGSIHLNSSQIGDKHLPDEELQEIERTEKYLSFPKREEISPPKKLQTFPFESNIVQYGLDQTLDNLHISEKMVAELKSQSSSIYTEELELKSPDIDRITDSDLSSEEENISDHNILETVMAELKTGDTALFITENSTEFEHEPSPIKEYWSDDDEMEEQLTPQGAVLENVTAELKMTAMTAEKSALYAINEDEETSENRMKYKTSETVSVDMCNREVLNVSHRETGLKITDPIQEQFKKLEAVTEDMRSEFSHLDVDIEHDQILSMKQHGKVFPLKLDLSNDYICRSESPSPTADTSEETDFHLFISENGSPPPQRRQLMYDGISSEREVIKTSLAVTCQGQLKGVDSFREIDRREMFIVPDPPKQYRVNKMLMKTHRTLDRNIQIVDTLPQTHQLQNTEQQHESELIGMSRLNDVAISVISGYGEQSLYDNIELLREIDRREESMPVDQREMEYRQFVSGMSSDDMYNNESHYTLSRIHIDDENRRINTSTRTDYNVYEEIEQFRKAEVEAEHRFDMDDSLVIVETDDEVECSDVKELNCSADVDSYKKKEIDIQKIVNVRHHDKSDEQSEKNCHSTKSEDLRESKDSNCDKADSVVNEQLNPDCVQLQFSVLQSSEVIGDVPDRDENGDDKRKLSDGQKESTRSTQDDEFDELEKITPSEIVELEKFVEVLHSAQNPNIINEQHSASDDKYSSLFMSTDSHDGSSIISENIKCESNISQMAVKPTLLNTKCYTTDMENKLKSPSDLLQSPKEISEISVEKLRISVENSKNDVEDLKNGLEELEEYVGNLESSIDQFGEGSVPSNRSSIVLDTGSEYSGTFSESFTSPSVESVGFRSPSIEKSQFALKTTESMNVHSPTKCKQVDEVVTCKGEHEFYFKSDGSEIKGQVTDIPGIYERLTGEESESLSSYDIVSKHSADSLETCPLVESSSVTSARSVDDASEVMDRKLLGSSPCSIQYAEKVTMADTCSHSEVSDSVESRPVSRKSNQLSTVAETTVEKKKKKKKKKKSKLHSNTENDVPTESEPQSDSVIRQYIGDDKICTEVKEKTTAGYTHSSDSDNVPMTSLVDSHIENVKNDNSHPPGSESSTDSQNVTIVSQEIDDAINSQFERADFTPDIVVEPEHIIDRLDLQSDSDSLDYCQVQQVLTTEKSNPLKFSENFGTQVFQSEMKCAEVTLSCSSEVSQSSSDGSELNTFTVMEYGKKKMATEQKYCKNQPREERTNEGQLQSNVCEKLFEKDLISNSSDNVCKKKNSRKHKKMEKIQSEKNQLSSVVPDKFTSSDREKETNTEIDTKISTESVLITKEKTKTTKTLKSVDSRSSVHEQQEIIKVTLPSQNNDSLSNFQNTETKSKKKKSKTACAAENSTTISSAGASYYEFGDILSESDRLLKSRANLTFGKSVKKSSSNQTTAKDSSSQMDTLTVGITKHERSLSPAVSGHSGDGKSSSKRDPHQDITKRRSPSTGSRFPSFSQRRRKRKKNIVVVNIDPNSSKC